ncbi:S-layer homology domain-containing protein [Paenibacillus doosanensis]|uniref:SLH domain-containing protein n=1 Tax=Paenibacillus konkukensis TaxID=2020716 RepID=A0ABY4RL02_9BACL|nr:MULTISPECIES: S-layer homology domain-containing protein [Paenibacillus]MCS7463662.1 S-layer homology domain-containing protein [Paenibacillus doosanensis]UQZ83187.1 hypothetical protein SK3146_02348 [Paenibacillus konkukensis]
MGKLIFSLLMGCSLAFSCVSAGYAETLNSGMKVRNEDYIRAKWKQYAPDNFKTAPFEKTPRLQDVYDLGKANGQYLAGGVARANFYRFIARLPDNLELSQELSRQLQYAASVTAATYGELSVKPEKPGDMDDFFYEQAVEGLGKSSAFILKEPSSNRLADTVDMYMNPAGSSSDQRNQDDYYRILDPGIQRIGFGLAPDPKDQYRYYSVMNLEGGTSSEPADGNYIAYPAEGSFPADVFDPRNRWLILFNSYSLHSAFSSADFRPKEGYTVELTRHSDRHVWTNRATGGADGYLDTAIDKDVTRLTFRPIGLESIADGDVFTVKVSGLNPVNGKTLELQYDVRFFYINKPSQSSQKEPSAPEQELMYPDSRETDSSGSAGQSPGSPGGSADIRFSDTKGHWSEQTVRWAIGKKIVDGYPDGRFEPDKRVSEEEFLSMLLKAYGHNPAAEASGGWSDGLYEFAREHKYPVKGAEQTDMRSLPVTREKAAEIVAAADGADVMKEEAILYLLDRAYASGKTDNGIAGFAGQDVLTRAEALQLIRNLQEKGMNELK